MPCETDEEGTVVAKVGGPPVLRGGLQGGDVLFELSNYKLYALAYTKIEGERVDSKRKRTIDLGKGRAVVEAAAKGVGLVRVLAQHSQVQLTRPPLAASSASTSHGALARASAKVGAVRAESGLQNGLWVGDDRASRGGVAIAVDDGAAHGRGEWQSANNGQDVLERHRQVKAGGVV